MASPDSQIFLASRRFSSLEGKTYITLISVKGASKIDIEESMLKEQSNCELGDFILLSDGKLEKIDYLPTKVVDNFARVSIEDVEQTQRLYFRLANPETLPTGEQVHFVGTNVKSLDGHLVPSDLAAINPAPIRSDLIDLLGSAAVPILQTTGGSGPAPEGSTSFVEFSKGVGIPKKRYINHKKPNYNQGGFVGKGFTKGPIVGAGFAVPTKDVIVGEGFVSDIKPQILRVVVLSIDENVDSGINTHFVWILDRQAVAKFDTTKYRLAPGHFFEGSFLQNVSDQKWNCAEYRKRIVKPAKIDGGIDFEGKIWFSVIINGFQPAGGNRKFAQATAKYFGDIIEGECEGTKLTPECNGKRVKIQRRKLLEESVWMVVEILS
ncbi:hypothetical protein B9Z55_012658 [Caenorhabditis nigoni]|uniref:Uncharacterized protein n=1 Tax=Caenorhabditis nigoni TaxID=1611254 RepID=A0A2G5TY83_9PELO|nr:hypothetical protein B9Z55_012658 [Caenorhabditis nigoni]